VSRDKIVPVILSGGSGTRLWPVSRALYPKQLLPLMSERGMLQETVLRVGDPELFGPPLIVCNDEHRFIIAEQMRQIGVEPMAILLEPVARNTAAATAAAALYLADRDADAVMLVMPSDHVIGDGDAFRAAVASAAQAAVDTALVTFGVTAATPETGYGYIRRGAALDSADGCYRVAEFVEKPARAKAARFVAAGDWFWNSGIFLFSARSYVAELERHGPATLAACREALRLGAADLAFFRLDREAFAAAPPVSIDYAVMEHTENAAIVPVEMGWSDIGSWSALWETGPRDARGNVIVGDVEARGVSDSYLRTDGRLLAAIGLTDVVIVVTTDAVLAVARDRVQEVAGLVEALRAGGRNETVSHPLVYRPWGSYESIDSGGGYQVKRITVNPGAALSLQKHKRRAEHWVVVAGVAHVTRGDETFELRANESTYIPVGTLHRLKNTGGEPLHLIEIQTGDYLGEDDIVRVADDYGRT
jgi:mannose-1-phosphate guanylyltransferase/mannose-1-phosphate guanylyltransferase/mannose-6-phosphate isomerase